MLLEKVNTEIVKVEKGVRTIQENVGHLKGLISADTEGRLFRVNRSDCVSHECCRMLRYTKPQKVEIIFQ